MERSRPLLRSVAVVLAAIAVGFAAISNQSLWMDEGATAFKALMPNLEEWWKWMRHFGTSDMQMPLYMLQVWAWNKMGALSEFALRTANLPWLVLTVFALHRVRFWPLVCLASPFIIYYAGELRPYAFIIAAAATGAAGLGRLIRLREEQPEREFAGMAVWCGSCLLLAITSPIGAVWAAGVGMAGLVMRPGWLLKPGFWLRGIPWLLAGGAVGSFYIYTLTQGWRAWGTEDAGVLNVLFGFYEMTGLYGLGPDRDILRDDPKAILSSIGFLAPAAIVLGAAWLVGVKSWMDQTGRRDLIAVATAIVLPITVTLMMGLVGDYRVIGRHMAPLVPVVLLPIAAAFTARGAWRRIGLICGSLAVGVMIASSLRLRFLQTYERDDYRSATPIAIEALRQGKTVLWLADMQAPRYYAYREGGMPLVVGIQVLESDQVSALMFADLVVINRPDLRPPQFTDPEALEANDFKLAHRFTGFEIWEMRP